MNVLDVVILTAFMGLAFVAGRSLMRTRNLTHVEGLPGAAPIITGGDSPGVSGDCGAADDCGGGGCDGGSS